MNLQTPVVGLDQAPQSQNIHLMRFGIYWRNNEQINIEVVSHLITSKSSHWKYSTLPQNMPRTKQKSGVSVFMNIDRLLLLLLIMSHNNQLVPNLLLEVEMHMKFSRLMINDMQCRQLSMREKEKKKQCQKVGTRSFDSIQVVKLKFKNLKKKKRVKFVKIINGTSFLKNMDCKSLAFW